MPRSFRPMLTLCPPASGFDRSARAHSVPILNNRCKRHARFNTINNFLTVPPLKYCFNHPHHDTRRATSDPTFSPLHSNNTTSGTQGTCLQLFLTWPPGLNRLAPETLDTSCKTRQPIRFAVVKRVTRPAYSHSTWTSQPSSKRTQQQADPASSEFGMQIN